MSEFSFIKGFLETSLVDWDGQLVSVIFTGGCNFLCPYCQNTPLVISPEKVETIPWQKILNFLQTKKNWLDGVCISGGEPLIHPEISELLKTIKNIGLKLKIDTNGSLPEVLKNLINIGLIDYVAMDLKSPLDNRYFQVAGKIINLENIKKSIDILKSGTIPFELRITCVPGLITEKEIKDLIPLIYNIPKFAIQGFQPQMSLNPEFRKIKPYSIIELEKLAEILKPHVKKVVVRS